MFGALSIALALLSLPTLDCSIFVPRIVMLPPLGQLPINAFLSSSDFENSPPSFQFESVDDELTRFASMLCYTEEMADALYNDITHSLTMTGYIQGEICQDAHSYELGWVTSSYQLIQTEHVWQIEVIVKTRSYPTAAMAWAMGGNEWHTSRGSVFVDVVGVEEEAKDKINDAMPKSPERFHSTESEDLFKQRDLKRKLAEINRNLRYVEGEKHTHLTDKLSELHTDPTYERVDAIDAKIIEYVPLVNWFERKERHSTSYTMVNSFEPQAVLGMRALLFSWGLLPEIKALLEAAFKEIAYRPGGPSFYRTEQNFKHLNKRKFPGVHNSGLEDAPSGGDDVLPLQPRE